MHIEGVNDYMGYMNMYKITDYHTYNNMQYHMHKLYTTPDTASHVHHLFLLKRKECIEYILNCMHNSITKWDGHNTSVVDEYVQWQVFLFECPHKVFSGLDRAKVETHKLHFQIFLRTLFHTSYCLYRYIMYNHATLYFNNPLTAVALSSDLEAMMV